MENSSTPKPINAPTSNSTPTPTPVSTTTSTPTPAQTSVPTPTPVNNPNIANNQIKTPQPPKPTHKTKLWVALGIAAGVLMAAGITVGVLAANGVFNGDDSCPAGKYRVCGPLAGGETACGCHSDPNIDLKPIIYLYPETTTELTVKLGAPEKLTSSYPKYTDGWNVVAYPGGDLIDTTTGNKLYSLYWEGEVYNTPDKSIGFMVKGTDSAKFLEEKLEILGLNYKEKEEFIVYWLPKLEAHNYNYIYFATEEEIAKEMLLELSVKPDTTIRIGMVFEGLDEYREVTEQTLTPAPERNGFTVVEWGGTELSQPTSP